MENNNDKITMLLEKLLDISNTLDHHFLTLIESEHEFLLENTAEFRVKLDEKLKELFQQEETQENSNITTQITTSSAATTTVQNNPDMELRPRVSYISNHLVCIFSGELLRNPVIADDGYTYEKGMIERWIDMHPDRGSPVTRGPVSKNTLRPNYTLKGLLGDENAKRLLAGILPPNLNLLEMLQYENIGVNLVEQINRLKKLFEIFFNEPLNISILKQIDKNNCSYTTQWLSEAERTFRDAASYLIDGDSLLLTAVSHCNVNWNNYGHTIHCVHIAERLLYMLFKKTHKTNYTIVFFNSHTNFLQKSPLLSLLRQCFIKHFEKNVSRNAINVRIFSSWLSNDYIGFLHRQKPLFILYNDMRKLKTDQLPNIDTNNLNDFIALYRLFADFHQNVSKCYLYLMNKIEFNNTSICCFQLHYTKSLGIKLISIFLAYLQQVYKHSDESEDLLHSKASTYNENLLCICYHDTITNDVRLYHYLLASITMIEENPNTIQIVPYFILHIALLIRLSIADRHIKNVVNIRGYDIKFPTLTFSDEFSKYIRRFHRYLACSLSVISNVDLNHSRVGDMFDERLFAFTLLVVRGDQNLSFDIDTTLIIKKCLACLDNICGLPEKFKLKDKSINMYFYDLTKELISERHVSFCQRNSQHDKPRHHNNTILEVSNRVINKYLDKTSLPNNIIRSTDQTDENSPRPVYEGCRRWKRYYHFGNEIDMIDDDDKVQNMSDRRYQLYYRYLTLYGDSLTKTEKPEQGIVQIKVPPSNREVNSVSLASVLYTGSSNAEKIKAENTKTKASNQKKTEEEMLRNTINEIKELGKKMEWKEALKTIDQRVTHIETKEFRLELFKKKVSIFEKHFFQPVLTLDATAAAIKATASATDAIDNTLKIAYFTALTNIVNLDESITNYWANDYIQGCMKQLLGRSQVTKELWYRWQIEHIDSLLPRYKQNIEDERVVDYNPDDWQVQFLDAVDRKESCIIIAPTSSGKTYASYYAIDSVLKKGNDGICIYVGPTKPLINQVHATVHSKYCNKNYSLGIFTRDFRCNVEKCRVLFTVPQCLEILLLSPLSEHQDLCRKVEYVIFDEMHYMSNVTSWERCMALLDSPMIGLSATMSNGHEIQNWLKAIEHHRYELKSAKSVRRVRLIVSHKRLTDLRKYLYSNQQLHCIHPIGLMDSEQLVKHGCLPNDLMLSPNETLKLYDAMGSENNHNHIQTMEQYSLNIPLLEQYFDDDWIIEREKFDTYGQLILNQFNKVISDKNLTFMNLIKDQLSIDHVTKEYPQRIEFRDLIISFILTLQQNNRLPCIVFNENRRICEDMAKYIAEYFKIKEEEIRQSKSFQNDIKNMKKRQREIEEYKNQLERRPKNKNNEDAATTCEEYRQISTIIERKQTGILPECTLITREPSHTEEKFLERVDYASDTEVLDFIKRGVAYHHAGMNKSVRVAIEALFRTGYLKVIFSTSTLASGIHMPCKTVAFVNDSLWLDTFYYRQASGRAGRRGFDLEGNVVFLNIPLLKIGHLIMSHTPDIYSHFPTTITFLMRILTLYTKSTTEEHEQIAYVRALNSLEYPLILSLNTPRISSLIRVQARYHCLYTLDFLRRLNLINERGELIGLGGLMTHLLPHEPANLLLSYLIEKNLFCKDHFETEYNKQIIMILSYLFTHLPWYVNEEQYRDRMKKRKDATYNSIILLPEAKNMPKYFCELLNEYNELVMFVYEPYIVNVINELRRQLPNTEQYLPLTNINFETFDVYDDGTFEYQLHHHHTFQNKTFLSPFTGVSGIDNDDYINTYNSLSYDLAYDLDLSPQLVPYFQIDDTYRLNSYAYDFYNHRSVKDIVNQNHIQISEIYTLLNDFRIVLRNFEEALGYIVKKTDDDEADTFFQSLHSKIKEISQEYQTNFNKTTF